MIDDVIIRYIKLPATIPGFTARSPDGCMNVYLNCTLTQEQQAAALEHELTHIMCNHFECCKPLDEVEMFS